MNGELLFLLVYQRVRLNDAPWCADFRSYEIMSVKLNYNHQKWLLEQTPIERDAQWSVFMTKKWKSWKPAKKRRNFLQNRFFIFWEEFRQFFRRFSFRSWNTKVWTIIDLPPTEFGHIFIFGDCRDHIISEILKRCSKVYEKLWKNRQWRIKCYFEA